MRLVLPPENPDIDGAASAYAYAEYLNKTGVDATAAVFGDLDEDAEQAFEEKGESLSDAKYYLYSADDFVLVSGSSMENVSRRVSQEKVAEVIDHVSDAIADFTEAETVIDENFSTAAGIIAERFRDEEVEISRESAFLLKKAINAADEISVRDEEIAEWLEEQ